MKKTKKALLILISLVLCLSIASCSDENGGTMSETTSSTDSVVSTDASNVSNSEESNASDEHNHNKNADFVLHLEAIPSETEPGIINAVITLSHIKQETSAIQFDLSFTSNTVEGVYTTNDEMAKTMTVVPMYKTTAGTTASRYEQICVLNKASSYYRCMYVDLISYPSAEEGQTFTGMKDDGEMVITIPFKVNSDASVGSVVKFEFLKDSITGTKTEGLTSITGDGTSATYTLSEKDIVK